MVLNSMAASWRNYLTPVLPPSAIILAVNAPAEEIVVNNEFQIVVYGFTTWLVSTLFFGWLISILESNVNV